MFVFNDAAIPGDAHVAVDLRVAEAVSRLAGPNVAVEEVAGASAALRVSAPGRGRSRRAFVTVADGDAAATVRIDLDGRRDFPLSRRPAWEDLLASRGWASGGREWGCHRAVDGNFSHGALLEDVSALLTEVSVLERVADRISGASDRSADGALMAVLCYVRHCGRLLADGTVVAAGSGLAMRVRERVLLAAVSAGLMAVEVGADGVGSYSVTAPGLALASGDLAAAAAGIAA